MNCIIKWVQAGDANAISEIYEMFFDKIYFYVRKRVDTDEDWQDITSDIFIIILDQIHSFKKKSKLSTWIFSITRNKLAEFWRSKSYDSKVIFEDIIETIESKNITDDEFEQEEKRLNMLHNKVNNIINTYLSKKPKTLFRLRFLQNYSLKDAALELWMEYNTVKVMQRRALSKLRELVKEDKIKF